MSGVVNKPWATCRGAPLVQGAVVQGKRGQMSNLCPRKVKGKAQLMRETVGAVISISFL